MNFSYLFGIFSKVPRDPIEHKKLPKQAKINFFKYFFFGPQANFFGS